MPSVTLLDLITEILVDIAELSQGETPSPEDSSYCMGKANEMLDSWQTERLNIYSIQELALWLVANQQSYQIGTGGADFPNDPRPIKIDACVILVPVNGVDVRLGECDLISESRWREITDPSATSNAPEMLYFDYGWPFGTLYFYPIPKAAVATIAQLSVWLALQQFVALTDEFEMPYGYQKAFVDGLRVVVQKSYGHPLAPDDAAMEQSSKARIQGLNAALPNLGISNGIAPIAPPQAPPGSQQ
jgi:hypothetical protein